MDFVQHSINWCRGEVFEGKLSLIFGLVLLIVGVAYKLYSSTPISKVMAWPLIVTAAFALSMGLYLMSANAHRIKTYPQAFQSSPSGFIDAEKERTEAFIAWYPITRYIVAVVMLIAMLMLMFADTPWPKAIAISLLVLGLYVFVLDLFSEERAQVYHEHIINALS